MSAKRVWFYAALPQALTPAGRFPNCEVGETPHLRACFATMTFAPDAKRVPA